MTYETKAIFSQLADGIGRAKTVREAYNIVVKAANIEGVQIISYDEFVEQLRAYPLITTKQIFEDFSSRQESEIRSVPIGT